MIRSDKEIYFKKDGTVKFTKPKSNKNIEFTAVPIGTPSKGPLYTIVKGLPTSRLNGLKHGYVKMIYGIVDTPPQEENEFETLANFIDGESPYSFYPLVRQLMYANTFIENQGVDDRFIHVHQINVGTAFDHMNLFGDFSYKEMEKEFDRLMLKTNLEEISKNKSYLIQNASHDGCKYEFVDELPDYNSLDSFVLFPEIESMYRISTYDMHNFQALNHVSVELYYEPLVVRCSEKSVTDYVLEARADGSHEKFYDAVTVDQIFMLCIYVPQLIMIERSLYDMDVTVTVTIEFKGRSISLVIRKDEWGRNFSLFSIIQKLVGTVQIL